MGHQWKFVRVGGVDQVTIRSGADIVHLEDLDQKLWVALACPVKSLEFDSRTLELFDLDKDGRIRAPEIVAVSRWVRDIFKNPDDLLQGGEAVELAAINISNPTGAALHSTAQRVLRDLGKPASNSLTLTDVASGAKAFAAKPLNGDGVITPESTPDEALKRAITEILGTHLGVPDRNGKTGINLAKLEAFFSEAAVFLAWHDRADPTILPLGPNTAVAAEALRAVRLKVEDFFMRCRLADFDPRAAACLNQAETDYKAMGGKDLTIEAVEVLRLPLAQTEAGRALSLESGLNPAWRAGISAFRQHALEPTLGGLRELTEAAWSEVQRKLSPFSAWMAAKPVTAVEKLGVPRLRELMGSGIREQLAKLIQQDVEEDISNDQMIALEKLVRVQRDLFRLLNNFVSFSDFYQRRGAIFQAGTLYLDARSCELCVHVADTSKHAALAGLARTYLAYCDCSRQGEKMTIAAAITAGDSDHLMVGRNGVFYDRKGRDWDATITRIIDNPIGLPQALWAPYKKFVRMIEEQVAKRAAAADSAAQAKLGTTATQIVNLDSGKPGAPAPAKKVDVGTVAALGVALGSLGTFLGVIFTKFVDLGWWIPMALVGLVLAISGPSVLIAWLKLRERNLGPILDANGWAVNGRMKVNVPFGGALSKRAKVPPGSERQLVDPFVERHYARNLVFLFIFLAILLGLLWKFNALDKILPENLRHESPSDVITNTVNPATIPTP